MSEWLPENWWALWLTVFLVFAVVEMITLDLFFIMLGGGALAGLVADFAGADPWLQIIAFCVVSLLMIGFVRPVALKHLHKGPADRRTNIERLIGESAARHGGGERKRRARQDRRGRLECAVRIGSPGARTAGCGQRHRRGHRDRGPAAGIRRPIAGGKTSGGRTGVRPVRRGRRETKTKQLGNR